jgi:hydroxymethylglutaryl-CoA reductase (NADPH)
MPLPSPAAALALAAEWQRLRETRGDATAKQAEVALRDDEFALSVAARGNIERPLGKFSLPIGVVGPVLLEGRFARGEYLVPFVTTEGTLVASYNRGAKAARLAGGFRCAVSADHACRAPSFNFRSVHDAASFIDWLPSQVDAIRAAAESTSSHLKFCDFQSTPIAGRSVCVLLRFSTGLATGQNMSTLASEAVSEFLRRNSPIPVLGCLNDLKGIDSDKVATTQLFHPYHTRGKRVTAEVELSDEIVRKTLRTTPDDLLAAHEMFTASRVHSGDTMGNVMASNGIAAMFLATGQDVASLAESMCGHLFITRGTDGRGLYASITMPDVLVGTVGGGTGLESARACLEMVLGPDYRNDGDSAKKLAEIFAACVLAGEISCLAAIASGEFAKAHATFRPKSKL